MRYQAVILIVLMAVFASCKSVICLEIKTEIGSSRNIKESRDKKVFQYEMYCDAMEVQLSITEKVRVKEAFVEHKWLYDCHDKLLPTIIRDTLLQLVLNLDYLGAFHDPCYSFEVSQSIRTPCFGSCCINLNYKEEDTLFANITQKYFDSNDKTVIRKVKFYKRPIEK